MSIEGHKQALPAGYRLRTYRVLRVLGVGGFGVTYLCDHARLGVQVAVKEYLPNEIAVRDGIGVHPKSAGDREGFEWGLRRFLDEARTLGRFEHPNVVRVRDCFEANSTAYIVMDYEDGESLDRLLGRLGTLTEAQLKRVVLPLAEGLRQVHAAGFLHRDIKPSNIFVRRSDESPVLLDFGSARQALGRKSRSMTAVASAGYSPPEQYESQGDQGAWTDIYALSALCHRAITGEAPVEAPRRTGELVRSRPDPQARLAVSGATGYSSGLLEAVDWGLRVIESERPSLDDWLAWMAEPKDASEAALRCRKAAEQGSTAAQAKLGDMYCSGEGVPKDAGEAVRWYRKAAEQGVPRAQYQCGLLYGHSLDVPRDAREAARWFRKAAEQGHASAQFMLGVHCRDGEGVFQDASEAGRWFCKAAEQGDTEAQVELGDMYCSGEGVPKDAREAARWYRKAAERGDAQAQLNLGVLYDAGDGVPKDAREVVRWIRKAAEQGHAEAQIRLGGLYEAGEGVPKDAGRAMRWYRKAAEQGSAAALYYLETMDHVDELDGVVGVADYIAEDAARYQSVTKDDVMRVFNEAGRQATPIPWDWEQMFLQMADNENPLWKMQLRQNGKLEAVTREVVKWANDLYAYLTDPLERDERGKVKDQMRLLMVKEIVASQLSEVIPSPDPNPSPSRGV